VDGLKQDQFGTKRRTVSLTRMATMRTADECFAKANQMESIALSAPPEIVKIVQNSIWTATKNGRKN
jgi:hypothetical protein